MGLLVPIIGTSNADAETYTLGVLPDTQNYSALYPETYEAQTQWLVDNRDVYDIVFTAHVGDLVDYSTQYQWDNANRAMSILDDAGMNYAVTPGNHDLYGDNGARYRQYYGPDRFKDMPTYGAHSPSKMSSYHIMNMGEQEIMVLSVDIDAPDEEIQWSQSQLDAHPDTPTILNTHIIMDPNGNILDQPYMRKNGNYLPQGNSPQDIWDELVLPNKQVFLTLNGHYAGSRYEKSFNAAGLEAHRVLVDYQKLTNGGDGYLRLMEFDFDENEIRNITYSPTKDDYLTTSSDEYSISIDFENRFKNIVQMVPEGTVVAPNIHDYSSSDTTKGGRTVDQLVGGQGISSDQEAVTLDSVHAAGTYDAAAEGMWTSKSGEPIDEQFVTFDLGRQLNVEKVAIWQFAEGLAEYGLDFSDRGAKEIVLSVASVVNPEADDFTKIGEITLEQYQQGEELRAQLFDLEGANEIRYIKFDFESNWGDPNYVGLSEVRFLSGVPVPEPTSAIVLAGLVAPVLMRRRKGRHH